MFELTELAVRVLQTIPTVTDAEKLRRMLEGLPEEGLPEVVRCQATCPTCGQGCGHDVDTHCTILSKGRRDDRHVCFNEHRWEQL